MSDTSPRQQQPYDEVLTLRRQLTRFEAITASLQEAVYVVDLHGRITYCNEAWLGLTGYQAEEVLGRASLEFYPAAIAPVFHERRHQASTGKRVPPLLQTEIIKRDAARIPVELSVTDFIMHGRRVGRIAAVRDISARRQMEDELLRTRKLESLGVLAGGIAHEFNNLLMVILGNISLARAVISPEQQAVGWLTKAEHACQQATALAGQLLAFSRGGAPVRQALSLADLLRESATFTLHGANVNAILDIAEELWPVQADSEQIHQVIHNLILNAMQAMPQGGTVRLQATNVMLDAGSVARLPRGRYVGITISDHGCGIPADALSNIFDPYFSTREGSRGLGLTTVYSIIARHDGAVTVTSEVDAGTTFTVYLPAFGQAMQPLAGNTEKLTAGTARILVMDDEAAIRDLLRAMLTRLGYTVDCARDGAEAIALYTEASTSGQPFAAVILDLTVPGGMGGREAIARLRAIDAHVRALVSSGYANDPVMADFQRYGFRGMAKKPYTLQTLQNALQQVLHGRDGA